MKRICIISSAIFLLLIAGCEESIVEKGISSSNNPNSNITLQNGETDIRVVKSEQKAEAPQYPSQEKQIDAQHTLISVSKKIHERFPTYTFKLVGNDSKDGPFYPSHAEIWNSSNGRLIQILQAKDRFDNDGRGLTPLFTDLEFTDLNNDGYLDLRILTEMGATGNDWYATYIYMPGLKKYKYHESLSTLSGVRLDPKSKQIKTYWRKGWCSEFIEYFKMDKNGNLVLHKIACTEMGSLDSNKACFGITGIPRHKNVTNLGYDFYHGGDDDSDAFLQKKVKVIKKDIIYNGLDECNQNTVVESAE